MMHDREESGAAVPVLLVHLPDGRTLRFHAAFHIGRDADCEVQIADAHVSRRHAVVSFADDGWSVHDLQSSNGICVDGLPVETAPIGDGLTISLGADGPALRIAAERLLAPPAPASVRPGANRATGSPGGEATIAGLQERYFGPANDEDEEAGGRTIIIRRLYQQIRKQQRRKYMAIVAVVALAGLGAGGYAWYGQRQLGRQEAVAQDLFYAMKSLDVHIAEVEQLVAGSGQTQGQDQVGKYMAQRRQLEKNYDQFVAGLSARFYDHQLTEEEQLILRVTRLFGECELAAPADYISEVKLYIRRWQSNGRFARALKLAQDLGYTRPIAEAFLKQSLPPQFFYLAMQESDFEPFSSGRPTRWGIAKGMWQFIPETGRKYGLKIGPLAGERTPDPADDRQHWEKATPAAARYIKDIYATDAQASGLLVMASYNWGEHRVIDLLRTMPADPKERNFWKVLAKHRERLPPETYNYVFSIVSAAVIGENPRLFGIAVDRPLAFLEQS
jgi:membrane-bound lytic murein transglycosylase D